MGKRILILLLLFYTSGIIAQTVLDPECVKQVTDNALKAKIGEINYANQLQQVKEKQEKNKDYSATIAVARTLYETAMQNADNFGIESLIYQRMITKATGILTKTPQVIKYLSKDPKRAGLGYTRMMKIEAQAKGLVDEMCSIVSGGKMPNPFKDGANNQDGHNMLNTYDRMTSANIILEKLTKLNFSLDVLLFRFKYEDEWINILRDIDPKSIFYAADGYVISNEIISGFKKW